MKQKIYDRSNILDSISTYRSCDAVSCKNFFVRSSMEEFEKDDVFSKNQISEKLFMRLIREDSVREDLISLLSKASFLNRVYQEIFPKVEVRGQSQIVSSYHILSRVNRLVGSDSNATPEARLLYASLVAETVDMLGIRADVFTFGDVRHKDFSDVQPSTTLLEKNFCEVEIVKKIFRVLSDLKTSVGKPPSKTFSPMSYVNLFSSAFLNIANLLQTYGANCDAIHNTFALMKAILRSDRETTRIYGDQRQNPSFQAALSNFNILEAVISAEDSYFPVTGMEFDKWLSHLQLNMQNLPDFRITSQVRDIIRFRKSKLTSVLKSHILYLSRAIGVDSTDYAYHVVKDDLMLDYGTSVTDRTDSVGKFLPAFAADNVLIDLEDVFIDAQSYLDTEKEFHLNVFSEVDDNDVRAAASMLFPVHIVKTGDSLSLAWMISVADDLSTIFNTSRSIMVSDPLLAVTAHCLSEEDVRAYTHNIDSNLTHSKFFYGRIPEVRTIPGSSQLTFKVAVGLEGRQYDYIEVTTPLVNSLQSLNNIKLFPSKKWSDLVTYLESLAAVYESVPAAQSMLGSRVALVLNGVVSADPAVLATLSYANRLAVKNYSDVDIEKLYAPSFRVMTLLNYLMSLIITLSGQQLSDATVAMLGSDVVRTILIQSLKETW